MRFLVNRAADIMTGLMFVCVLVITVIYVRREFFHKDAPGVLGGGSPITKADWAALASDGRRIGSPSATVTIVEFGDFECPFCGHFATGTMKAIQKQYPEAVSFLFRHFPLPQHRMAYPAARAAECAADQNRFEQFHDAVFAAQDSIALLPFTEYARRSGVADPVAFDKCNGQQTPVPRVDADVALGKRLKVPATPTVYVNGWQLRSVPDSATLDSVVRSFLPKALGAQKITR